MLPFLIGSPIFLDASLFKLEPPLLWDRRLPCVRRLPEKG
jgi:hypothetical protein